MTFVCFLCVLFLELLALSSSQLISNQQPDSIFEIDLTIADFKSQITTLNHEIKV